MITSDEAFAQTWAKWTDQERAEYETERELAQIRLDLAEVVYTARTEAGMTQTELAQAMGVSQSYVSTLEGGGVMPTVNTLAKLAKATHRTLRIDVAAA